MEAEIRPLGRQLNLERDVPANRQTQRRVVLLQQPVHVRCEPTLVTELERVAVPRMVLQRLKELLQSLQIELPAAWELEQQRPQLGPEPARVVQQPLERLFGVGELLHVGQVAPGLDRKAKANGRVRPPG